MELDEFVSIAKKNTGKSSGKDYLLFDSLWTLEHGSEFWSTKKIKAF
jgi:hypothetical protein